MGRRRSRGAAPAHNCARVDCLLASKEARRNAVWPWGRTDRHYGEAIQGGSHAEKTDVRKGARQEGSESDPRGGQLGATEDLGQKPRWSPCTALASRSRPAALLAFGSSSKPLVCAHAKRCWTGLGACLRNKRVSALARLERCVAHPRGRHVTQPTDVTHR